MKRLLALLFFVCLGARAGVLNPDVTQRNIKQTICVPGWTATVRPPTSYTTPIKRELMTKQGFDFAKQAALFELDHAVPLTLGGAPRDRKNLVLQKRGGSAGAEDKDGYEKYLNRQVCSGKMTLFAARRAIYPNWYINYKRMVKGEK